MNKATHIYGFRIFSILALITVAIMPIVIKPTLITALILFPSLLIGLMIVLAIGEQFLLRKIEMKSEAVVVKPIRVHKLQMKKVRSHRHSGCRLLGLSCAA